MSIKHRWPLRAVRLGASISVLAAGPALADPAPPFSELLSQAQSAPTLAISRSDVEQAQGLAQLASARPNPSVSLLVENFGGPRPYDQLGGQTTFQVDQPIELGGKRAARIAAGRAGVDAAKARYTESVAAFGFDLASA